MKFSRVNYAKASSLFYIATRLYPWNKCSRHLTFKSPIKLFLMISDPFCSQSDGLFELNRYVIVSEALTSRNVSWWFETSYPLSKCCSNCGSQGIIHTHRHYIHIPVSIHLFFTIPLLLSSGREAFCHYFIQSTCRQYFAVYILSEKLTFSR